MPQPLLLAAGLSPTTPPTRPSSPEKLAVFFFPTMHFGRSVAVLAAFMTLAFHIDAAPVPTPDPKNIFKTFWNNLKSDVTNGSGRRHGGPPPKVGDGERLTAHHWIFDTFLATSRRNVFRCLRHGSV
jgi:hypothetical protein